MELEHGFRAIRNSVEREVPPDSLRQDLLREFAQAARSRARRKLAVWSVTAIAAALLCFVALRHEPLSAVALRHGTFPAQPRTSVRGPLEATLELPLEDGFQAVPYAAAPSEGEFVRVVHTQLAPDTLTRMGVFIASASGDSIPVDLVVGQDNAPLAVRVNDENESEYKETP